MQDKKKFLFYFRLANALQTQGRLDEAIDCYRQAIDCQPDDMAAHFNQGVAFRKLGRLPEAVACYRRAVDLKPDFAATQYGLGVALKELERLDEAAACFCRVLDLAPDHLGARGYLGFVLRKQGRPEEAAACYREIIDRKRDDWGAYMNLGVLHHKQGRLEEAAACYRDVLALRPDEGGALRNLGATLQALGQLDEAAACYRRMLDREPNNLEAIANLGSALKKQRRLEEAIACFRRLIALRPDDVEAHAALGNALLLQGDMPAGWQEYEWRLQRPNVAAVLGNFSQPRWRGEAAAGRTLLILGEGGFGDTIQFCRYAPLVAAAGLRVVMAVQKPLARLLGALPGVELTVSGSGAPLPAFDLYCVMFSLPLALGTTLATIPRAVSYLHADAALAAGWQSRLAAMADRRPRIGLAWAGSARTPADPQRSLAPERLAPLFALSGLHFISLQKGGPAAPEGFPLTDIMHEMQDFADTAALIATLDLVIAVDTAVAHLAAALGKPVWLLDRFDPCWRWLLGRRDSPWYPTLRIYRQPGPGDWNPVLAAIVHDLRETFGL